MGVDLGLAGQKLGPVADPLLPLERCREIRFLHLGAERDVPDRLVGVRLRIGLPHLDARLHELAHRRLEVVVANDAAGDPGRPRAGPGLVEDDDVPSRADPAGSELARQVVGGRKAVDSGADDDVW